MKKENFFKMLCDANYQCLRQDNLKARFGRKDK